jgi:hypothetical protein
MTFWTRAQADALSRIGDGYGFLDIECADVIEQATSAEARELRWEDVARRDPGVRDHQWWSVPIYTRDATAAVVVRNDRVGKGCVFMIFSRLDVERPWRQVATQACDVALDA